MKALVYTANRKMVLRDEPAPQPIDGDALIGVESVGICGSDMHAWLGHDPRRVPPLILGHEAVGTVLAGRQKGRRVVLNPLITCGQCNECLSGRQNLCAKRDLIGMVRPGAFAEQITIPERNLIIIPDGMSSAKAALTEPGATGLHSVLLGEKVLDRPISEASALVIGGGSVGLLTALILLDKGVSRLRLAETNPLRRNTVTRCTDIDVFDPLAEPAAESSYDIVFDAVGGEKTRTASITAVKPGGVVVHIGLMDNDGGLDIRRITLQEITFIGCYTYSPMDLRVTLGKLYDGSLGDLGWLEQHSLEDGAVAFEDIDAGRCAAPKVILQI